MNPSERIYHIEQHRKADGCLVTRTIRKLGLKQWESLFAIAALYKGVDGGEREALEMFLTKSELPQWCEDFCIDFLADRITDLVIDAHQIKAKRRKT